MGIFSDECEVCHNKVRKAARFCNNCGTPAPGGWWKCPSCKKWIGNESRFCPHCNTPLNPENRGDIAGGIWQKDHTCFAERFEVGDINRLLVNGLQVQEGTLAILLDSGRVCDVLGSGRHEPDGILRKINWFGNPPPRSVVMIDAGEIAVPVSIEGLHTADPFPIEFYGEIIVRFKGTKEAAQHFTANFLKENRKLAFADVSEKIQSSIRTGVADCCATTMLDDLVRDPERRIRLHDRMTSELNDHFNACGLEIVRVSSAEFTGDEYEDYVAAQSQVDMERRRIEHDAALRSLTDKDEMSRYKDATELLEYKKIIDHEFRVEELDRELDFAARQERANRELEVLRQAWQNEDARRSRDLELEQKNHELRIKELEDESARLKTVGDAEAGAKADKIWLEVREIKEQMAANQKSIDAARRKNMPLEELIADIDDPDKREDLKAVYKLKIQSGMSEKQILAMQGVNAVGDVFLDEMKRIYKESAEREDNKLSKILEPAIEAAKAAPSGPNIIK